MTDFSILTSNKTILRIFLLAFVFNVAWEIFHSALYVHYQGAPITFFVLLRAAVVDACIIALLFVVSQRFRLNEWVVIIFGGVIVSVLIELYALNTGRWEYTEFMPIIPIIDVGLTPTIQLVVTGLISLMILRSLSERVGKDFKTKSGLRCLF